MEFNFTNSKIYLLKIYFIQDYVLHIISNITKFIKNANFLYNTFLIFVFKTLKNFLFLLYADKIFKNNTY